MVIQGTTVILQGRYIQHATLEAFRKERISMITAFRPRCPMVRDEMVLTGSRPISDQSQLVYDYTMYRAKLLEARMRRFRKKLQEHFESARKFDVEWSKEFHQEFLEATLAEMIPIHDIGEIWIYATYDKSNVLYYIRMFQLYSILTATSSAYMNGKCVYTWRFLLYGSGLELALHSA